MKEHHAAVYAGTDGETIVKAQRAKDLLRGGIVTPSLEVAIINGRYVNSLSLCRMEQEFKRDEVTKNGMAAGAKSYMWIYRTGHCGVLGAYGA